MWGVIIVGFGMVNLIIWKYLKYNSIEVESTIIKKESFLNKSRYNRYSKMRYFRIEYSIENEVYENFIDADKKSYLYNAEPGDKYKIYICKKYPKLVIDDINKIKTNLLVAIISIIVGVVQLLVL